MPSDGCVQEGLSLIAADKPAVLSLTVGSHANLKPGTYIPRADAQSAPTIGFNGLSPSATYLVVGLDIDAPFPSIPVLGPVLHWIQPGLKAEGATLVAKEPFIANYIGPAPPPGSAPHRYSFFLFEQPAGLDVREHAPAGGKELGLMARVRYDLDKWVKENNIGPVLAANYFKSN